MSMINRIQSGIAPFLAFLAAIPAAGQITQKPNIILFLSDDHGWRDSGCYGNNDVRTPNIDRLAKEGMRFTHAYAASPLCSPSRCVIETGLMPHRNGGHYQNTPIRPGVTTLPVYFKQLGYYTAEIGKFNHPPNEAFPYDHTHPKDRTAVDFIRNYDRKEPLLLVVCSKEAHTPWAKNTDYDPGKIGLPPNFVNTPRTFEDRANYYTDVTNMDSILGDVLKAVDERGLRDDTLFVYTTDQGANWPFAKWCVYDAGLRVPFIVRWPDKVAANSATDAMVSLVDLVPTFLAAASSPQPDNLDGRSFLKVLTGETNQHRQVVFGTHTGNKGAPGIGNRSPARTIITPRYQYVLNLSPETTFATHITGCKPSDVHYLPFWDTWTEQAKTDKTAEQIVNAYLHRQREELYDLSADPYEMHNLADDPSQADLRRSLRQQLADWCRQQGDTDPLEYLEP